MFTQLLSRFRPPVTEEARIAAAVAGREVGTGAGNPLRLSGAELAELTRAVPLDGPIAVKGGRLSFGFEAEFRAGEGPQDVVSKGAAGRWKVNTDRFGFLETRVTHEKSGNTEVISRPTEDLGEALRQMKELRAHLGSSLRSFHFTIQTPQQAVNEIGKDAMTGWMSRLGDSVQAWRLMNRKPFFALNTWSQVRRAPSEVNQRGPLRAYPLQNGRYRIELRGYMNSVDSIKKRAVEIAAGLQNPEYVRGLSVEQAALLEPRRGAGLANELVRLKGGPLTEREDANLSKMIDGVMGEFGERNVLPLVGFEAAPYLSPAEREAYAAATKEFLQGTLQLMRTTKLGPQGLGSRFRELIRAWAERSGHQRVLDQTVLLRPAPKPAVTPELVHHVLELPLKDTRRWLEGLPPETLASSLAELSPEALARFVESLPKPRKAPELWTAVETARAAG